MESAGGRDMVACGLTRSVGCPPSETPTLGSVEGCVECVLHRNYMSDPILQHDQDPYELSANFIFI